MTHTPIIGAYLNKLNLVELESRRAMFQDFPTRVKKGDLVLFAMIFKVLKCPQLLVGCLSTSNAIASFTASIFARIYKKYDRSKKQQDFHAIRLALYPKLEQYLAESVSPDLS